MKGIAVFTKGSEVLDVIEVEVHSEEIRRTSINSDDIYCSKPIWEKRKQLEQKYGYPVAVEIQPIPRRRDGSTLIF